MSFPILLRGGHFQENYEHLWIIPKWRQVSQSDHLLKNHAWKFQTVGTSSKIETTWNVEWKLVPVEIGSPTKSCQVHWTLIDLKGMAGGVIAKIKTSVIKNNRDGPPDLDYQSDEQQRYFRLNETVQISFCWISGDVIKPDGDLSVQLNLTLVLPKSLEMERYEAKSENAEENREKVRKIKDQKRKKLKRKYSASPICWHDEWHKAEEVGLRNLNDNISTASHASGEGTNSQDNKPGNGDGIKSANRSKKKSKRIGKNDLMVNHGLKKIKLESDYRPAVKEEERAESVDDMEQENDSGTWESQDLRIFEEIVIKHEV